MSRPRRRFRRRMLLLPLLVVLILAGAALGSTHRQAAVPFLTTLPAATAGDHFVPTGDLVLQPGDVVERNAMAALGDVTVPAGATVTNDVIAGHGNVVIAGTVNHDVRAIDGDVTLAPSAVVGHDVVVLHGQLHREAGAQVRGSVSVNVEAAPVRSGDGGLFGLLAAVLVHLVAATILIAVGTVIILSWPRQIGQIAHTLETSPWAAGLVGLVTAALLPPALAVLAIVLAITIVGLLALPFLGLAVLLGWLLGTCGLGLWTGRRLADSGHFPQAQGSLLLTAALGLAVVAGLPLLLAAIVPWLGWPLVYLAGCVGAGGLVLTRLGSATALSRFPTAVAPRATHPLPPGDRRAS